MDNHDSTQAMVSEDLMVTDVKRHCHLLTVVDITFLGLDGMDCESDSGLEQHHFFIS